MVSINLDDFVFGDVLIVNFQSSLFLNIQLCSYKQSNKFCVVFRLMEILECMQIVINKKMENKNYFMHILYNVDSYNYLEIYYDIY